MTISIIIPTLNRPQQIIQLFKRLNSVVTDEQIIVVDDSTDSQKDKLRAVANFDLNYIHRGSKLGVSSARNTGARSAKGEYLIFFDDDDDFTLDWLVDFKKQLISNPDVVFCNMKRINPDHSFSIVTCYNSGNGAKGNGIVIPGAWILKKERFLLVGGFDERLSYAENTELFFRLDQLEITRVFVPRVNFHYYPSPTGGSKDLRNMIDSLTIILSKHDRTLSTHVKYLYNQIVGVNYMRFQNFSKARKYLLKAFSFKPYKVSTLIRFSISLIPPLAKSLYPEKIKV